MALWFEPTPHPYRPHDATWRQPLHLHLAPLWRELTRALARVEGEVVDVGCGAAPYRAMCSPRVTRYVGVDRASGEVEGLEVVEGDAHALPFGDGSFDAAVSFQALEHVERPGACVMEMARVLRPEGRAVITVPGVWTLHEAPRDFWRFTRYGLAELCREAGFVDVAVTPLGGLWSALGQMANLELERSRAGRLAVPLVNLAARAMDRRAHHELTLNWLVEARKPA